MNSNPNLNIIPNSYSIYKRPELLYSLIKDQHPELSHDEIINEIEYIYNKIEHDDFKN